MRARAAPQLFLTVASFMTVEMWLVAALLEFGVFALLLGAGMC